MHLEVDIDEQVQKYWANLTEKYGLPAIEPDLWQVQEFWNPTRDRPMSAAEFLSHFDPSAGVRILLRTYNRPMVVEKRLGRRVRASFLMLYKGYRHITQLYSHLKAEPEDAVLLGYEMDENGMVQLDSYETLREFINERLSPLWEEIMDAFLMELASILKAEGIPFGDEMTDDATFLRAVKGDNEAEYSGYYKANGYKTDIVVENKHNLPLRATLLDGDEGEGKCLPESLAYLHRIDLLPTVMYVDGGYTSYENIATAETKYRVELRYRIEVDWVLNPKGFEEYLRTINQKCWKDEGFKTNATIDYILRFLLEHGYTEEVGAHFRNMRMAEYEESPDCYLDVFHRRNVGEGFNGYAKDQIDLERDIPKGKEKVRVHTLSRLCSVIVVALTRAQNDVFDNLGSVAYIV